MRIELLDVSNNTTVCDSFITLSELPIDRFISRKFLLRNPKILDNVQSYLFSFTHIQVSFYLESDREAYENQNELFKSLIISNESYRQNSSNTEVMHSVIVHLKISYLKFNPMKFGCLDPKVYAMSYWAILCHLDDYSVVWHLGSQCVLDKHTERVANPILKIDRIVRRVRGQFKE